MESSFFYLIIAVVVVGGILVMAIINRYRRCPSDKILVIYGTTGNKSAKVSSYGLSSRTMLTSRLLL